MTNLSLVKDNNSTTELTFFSTGNSEEIENYKPEHYFNGIFALYKEDENVFHLLTGMEDRYCGLYNFNKEEIVKFKDIVSNLINSIEFNRYQTKPKNLDTFEYSYSDVIDNFELNIVRKNNIKTMVILSRKFNSVYGETNKEFEFDAYWLKDLEKVLSI